MSQPRAMSESRANVETRELGDLSAAERTLRTVVFVDSQQDVERLVPILAAAEAALAKPAAYFTTDRRLLDVLAEAAQGTLGGSAESFHRRVLPYATVNPAYDEALYGFALGVARKVAASVPAPPTEPAPATSAPATSAPANPGAETSSQPETEPRPAPRAGPRADHASLPREFRTALAVSLHDRFVASARPLLELAATAERLGFQQVLCFAAASAAGRARCEALAALLPGVSVAMMVDHHGERSKALAAALPSSQLYPHPERVRLPASPQPAFAPAPGATLVGTNLTRPQFALAALPVVSELTDTDTVSLFSSAGGLAPDVADRFDLATKLASGRLRVAEKVRPRSARPLREGDGVTLSLAVGTALEGAREAPQGGAGRFQPLGPLFAAQVQEHLLPTLWAINAAAQRLAPHVERAKRVVVVPGRTLEFSVMVNLARRFGVPSIEIQSGTVSRSQRFVRPEADFVLAMEGFSRAIFTDMHGMEPARVAVVGSPKLDADIAAMDVTHGAVDARKLPPGLDPSRPVFTLASQPVGLARMRRVLDTVLEGLEAAGDTASDGPGGVQLLIKPHPSETRAYHTLYARAAAASPFKVVVDADISALEAVALSDLVFTYYSTVGVEAFALGKPVVAVNPFGQPLPYDLVGLGMATEAATPGDVARIVRGVRRGAAQDAASSAAAAQTALAQTALAQTASALRGGGAAARAADFIRKASLEVPEPRGRGSILSRLLGRRLGDPNSRPDARPDIGSAEPCRQEPSDADIRAAERDASRRARAAQSVALELAQRERGATASRLATTAKSLADSKRSLARAREAVDAARERAEAFRTELQEARTENRELLRDKTNLQGKLDWVRASFDAARERAESAQAELQSLRAANKALRKDKASLQGQLERAEESAVATQERAETVRADFLEARAKNRELRQSQARLEAEDRNDTRTDLLKARLEAKELLKAQARLEGQLARARESAQAVQGRAESAQAELALNLQTARAEARELLKENARLESLAEKELLKARTHFQGQLARARESAQAVQARAESAQAELAFDLQTARAEARELLKENARLESLVESESQRLEAKARKEVRAELQQTHTQNRELLQRNARLESLVDGESRRLEATIRQEVRAESRELFQNAAAVKAENGELKRELARLESLISEEAARLRLEVTQKVKAESRALFENAASVKLENRELNKEVARLRHELNRVSAPGKRAAG